MPSYAGSLKLKGNGKKGVFSGVPRGRETLQDGAGGKTIENRCLAKVARATVRPWLLGGRGRGRDDFLET
jgi:hypothetical protein